jgi:hypothetical protein
MHRVIGITISAALFAAPTPAWAVIEVLMPLAQVIKDADDIIVAKVEKLDAEKPSAVFALGDALKGKVATPRWHVNLKGDKPEEAKKLVERLAVDLPIVLFAIKPEGDSRIMVLGYTGGTWFQIVGQPDGEQVRWAFTHVEPFLVRTYKGSTAELRTVVADALAGKKKAPPPNPKEKPGLGPTVAETAATN